MNSHSSDCTLQGRWFFDTNWWAQIWLLRRRVHEILLPVSPVSFLHSNLLDPFQRENWSGWGTWGLYEFFQNNRELLEAAPNLLLFPFFTKGFVCLSVQTCPIHKSFWIGSVNFSSSFFLLYLQLNLGPILHTSICVSLVVFNLSPKMLGKLSKTKTGNFLSGWL